MPDSERMRHFHPVAAAAAAADRSRLRDLEGWNNRMNPYSNRIGHVGILPGLVDQMNRHDEGAQSLGQGTVTVENIGRSLVEKGSLAEGGSLAGVGSLAGNPAGSPGYIGCTDRRGRTLWMCCRSG